MKISRFDTKKLWQQESNIRQQEYSHCTNSKIVLSCKKHFRPRHNRGINPSQPENNPRRKLPPIASFRMNHRRHYSMHLRQICVCSLASGEKCKRPLRTVEGWKIGPFIFLKSEHSHNGELSMEILCVMHCKYVIEFLK